MAQKRVKTGKEFETKVCNENGWTLKEAKPRLKFTGVGRSNIDKIHNAGYDISLFKPTNESVYHKYDALNKENKGIEIKKYNTGYASDNWMMYSEPFIAIKTPGILDKAISLIGKGDLKKANEIYNNFLLKLLNDIGEDVISKISSTSIGVQLEDGFIPQSKLEYKWEINKGWKGFNRIYLKFKIKIKS